MVKELVDLIVQSLVRPRVAMRSVIDRVEGYDGVGVILGLSVALNAAALILSMVFLQPESEIGAVSLAIAALFQALAGFVLMTGLVQVVGKLFGGKATLLDTATMVAWYNLVSVVFAPLVFGAGPMIEGGAIKINILHVASAALAIWLAANYIAEAHRFKSAARVAGVMFGLVFATAFLLMVVRP